MDKKTKALLKELEERLEALTIAVPKEEAAHKFYLDLGNSTKHKGARKMFFELSEQELEHKANLEKCVQDIKDEINRLKSGE